MVENVLPRQSEGGITERRQFTSDAQFRRLLEFLPVAAYTCDAAGLITYFNRQAEELWGRAPRLNDPADRWCGSFRLFDAADGSPISYDQCWTALAIKTGQPYIGQEIIIERANGERVTTLAHANPMRDEMGRLVGAVNVLVDISDQKRVEEAQSRLGAIVESSEDAIVGKSLEGIISSWNVGAERIFGYSAAEAIGQPITLIVPPERLLEEQEILARLRNGERVEHHETIRIAKDGRRLDISLTTSPIRDGNGRVIGASKVARDITAKKRNDAALRLLQEMSVRLSSALDPRFILDETLRTSVTILDADCGFILLKRRSDAGFELGATFGCAEDAFGGTEGGDPFPGWGPALQERIIVEDVEADPALSGHRETARRIGYRGVYSTPLITRAGEQQGVLALGFREPRRPEARDMNLVDLCARQAVDFMENARLYAELREADRIKNDFLAILAHELRNPLAPIRNTVATLQLGGPASPELKAAIAVIDRQLSLMTRLIDDLLDVSRITRDKLQLRKERIDLAEVLQSAIEASQPLLNARGHDFGVDLPPEPVLIDADLGRLSQVISNLLNNAAKYTQRGGRIRLAARREGNEAVVSVRDNGIGIPLEAQRRVFEMFAQADQSLDRSQGGLGIGLHLARRLTEMHGGTLSLKSAGLGAGAEFIVRLPVVRGTVISHYQGNRDQPSSFLPSALRILVVDDNRDAADSLGLLLGIPGNEVRVAYDGLHAVQMAEEFQPEVVLLDIGLPKIDGYEAARRIRETAWGKSATLIALTGWGQEEAKLRSQESGFDAHLVKPVEPAALLRRLATVRHPGEGRPPVERPPAR